MAFEIYRSRQNDSHYVAVRTSDLTENAKGVRASQNLFPFTTIPDDGRPHVGFDHQRASAAIAAHGFYAFEVDVHPREHFEK